MNGTDWKYLHLVSNRLERFADQGNDIYNFRCPFCGDSKKNKYKARGYIFVVETKTRFKCHNCGRSHLFSTFLKLLDNTLFQQYKLELFGVTKKEPKPLFDDSKLETTTSFSAEVLSCCVRLDRPTVSKKVVDYVSSRKIPERFYRSLYSVTDINKIIQFLPQYKDRQIPLGFALVMPFFRKDGSFDWIQCRLIAKNATVRFITLCVGNKTVPKIWGEENIDWDKPVYITEGPIDAMCLDNALSIAGASSSRAIDYIARRQTSPSIFCYDNDYSKNKEIKAQILKRVESKFGVVVFDKWFRWKDINAAVMSGIDIGEINTYIKGRTYFDLGAKLELSRLADNASEVL